MVTIAQDSKTQPSERRELILLGLESWSLWSGGGWNRARRRGTPTVGDPPLDVRGFHEGILTYHTMTHRYKEENER